MIAVYFQECLLNILVKWIFTQYFGFYILIMELSLGFIQNGGGVLCQNKGAHYICHFYLFSLQILMVPKYANFLISL